MTDSKIHVRTIRETSKGSATAAAAGVPVIESPRTAEEVHQLVAVTAYYLAEFRNFEPGHELEDWLTAEAQIRIELESRE